MSERRPSGKAELGLRAGEWVEVRSVHEVIRTLDDRGTLDGLPFMPEMLALCGGRFRVAKRAHKTCDTIGQSGGRRLKHSVHLEGVRCDGQDHGGCQALCLVFWKEAWLKRVSSADIPGQAKREDSDGIEQAKQELAEHAMVVDGTRGGKPTYRCQATELLRATTPLTWWDPRQYLLDVVSGNLRVVDLISVTTLRGLYYLMELGVGYRVWRWAYDRIERLRGGPPYPFFQGLLDGKTPSSELGLQPGELVRVKSKEQIVATLDRENKNRGMRFDPEMVRYCGNEYTVLSRVERIIDEESGAMIELPNECIILQGVVCKAECSDRRLFCPREIPSFWREIWLERAR